MKQIECLYTTNIAKAVSNNADVLIHTIRTTNKEICKLKKKSCCHLIAGIIFFLAAEACFAEQKQMLEDLEAKVDSLNGKIKELTGEEGD